MFSTTKLRGQGHQETNAVMIGGGVHFNSGVEAHLSYSDVGWSARRESSPHKSDQDDLICQIY